MVEFSLAFPLFMLILAVGFTVSQFLTSVIGLSGAARAGAIVAANDVNANPTIAYGSEVTDIAAAVNNEEGCSGSGCYIGVTSQASCPAGSSCVWFTTSTVNTTGERIDTIHVSHPVIPFVPLVKGISVQAQAGATP